MVFSQEAITLKKKYLDSINAFPELLSAVVSNNLRVPFELKMLSRHWEPGGGASLYLINTQSQRYFLKVKHCSIFVESRLESEPEFIHIPSLKNEALFLDLLNSPQTPKVIFYEERDDYSFLALEYLEPFEQAVTHMSANQLLLSWDKLESFVRRMYSLNIVHTDLHEGNLCFRKDELVVCDFEEARMLFQDQPFEISLDYCGQNNFGDVGAFPEETGKGIGGLTCLVRLRKVFQSLVLKRLRDCLAECNFDQNCPFNSDILQEEDPRIYQSINLAGLNVIGQRPVRDSRKNVFEYFLFRQSQRKSSVIRHVDIGSNLGIFCFLAVKQPFDVESIGLEAYDRYVEAANAIRFITDSSMVCFRQFVCGESDFDEIAYGGVDVCTLLSVYHHIVSRDDFLSSLERNRPTLILAEFATQERYYPERGSVAAEIDYIRARLGYGEVVTLMHSPDYGRPLVLFADEPVTTIDRIFMRLAATRLFSLGMALLRRSARARSKKHPAVA